MKLVKIKPNYRLYISKKSKNNPNENISVSFFSKSNPTDILMKIDSSIVVNENTNCRIYIKVYNLITRTGFVKDFPYEDKSGEEIKDDIMKQIYSLVETIDVKSSRYQLTVVNKFSSEIDSKTLTFNSNLSTEQLVEKLSDYLIQKYDELDDAEIEFSNTPSGIITHYLTIKAVGTLETRKNSKSKSFSIYFPDYSSKDIIRILKGENIE